MVDMKSKSLVFISLFLLSSCSKTPEEVFYQVVWVNEDNTILEVDTKVKEGDIPHYDGQTPTKLSDEVYDYEFNGWDKELTPVVKDIVYYATYDAIERKGYVLADHQSGFYDEKFQLTLLAPLGFDIYYTLDNSNPTQESILYERPIIIDDVSSQSNHYSLMNNISPLDIYYPEELVDKCQIVKAIAINKESKEQSAIYHFNYFVGFQNKSGYSNMPVISLNINDDDLFDYEKGIYVLGKIYDESEHTGYPETYPANYQQKGKEWEREANFKYFDANKELCLQQNIGIRIHGGWSRAFNQKSFNLYARKEYSGSSTIGYKLS